MAWILLALSLRGHLRCPATPVCDPLRAALRPFRVPLCRSAPYPLPEGPEAARKGLMSLDFSLFLDPHQSVMSLAKTIRFALGFGLFFGLWSCSGGGGGSGSKMSIQSCSLGCSSSGSGVQLSCPVTDVFVNQEIRVAFSAPVDISSVNNTTFQVKQDGLGNTPAGTFDLDPTDPTVVIYRPLLTFDSSGAPSFGLKDNATYNITIPGTITDPNLTSYIRNTSGVPNTTRLFCTVVASRGVFDVKSGQPRAQAFVDIDVGGSVTANQNPESDFSADDPVVSRFTDITITFDDIMNPATLVNPVTNESNSITIKVDTDGDISDPTWSVPSTSPWIRRS